MVCEQSAKQVPRTLLSVMQHISPSSQSEGAWQLSPSARLHADNKQAATKQKPSKSRMRARFKGSSKQSRCGFDAGGYGLLRAVPS